LSRLAEPRVTVRIDSVAADGEPGRWRVAWLVQNRGDSTIELESAWIPHGRFRGQGRLPLEYKLEANETRRLEFRVAAHEAPGTVVENAFLILRARGWRIFTRMRIEFDPSGIPWPVCEVTSVATIAA
jgi:hypothetical protein